MSRKDWDDSDDFDAVDDEGDEEDDSDNWTVEQWEADLQKQDERKRKMRELLDKYGHDDAGYRKAMEELGFGDIFKALDRRQAEQKDEPETAAEDGEAQIDKILHESRFAASNFDEPHFRLPLGQSAYELTLMVFKSIDGHDEIDSPDHPLVLYSGAFLDAQGYLAGMGYMREWDDEFYMDPPKNLKIAELKRAVKNYVQGLNHLEIAERQNLLAPEVCAPIREHAVAVLDEVRQELRQLLGKQSS